MKRGGGYLAAAASVCILASAFSSTSSHLLQGSETETATPTASDFLLPTFTPTETETETPTASGQPPTATASATDTMTATGAPAETPAATGTTTVTATPAGAPTPSETSTETPSETAEPILTPTPTATVSPTAEPAPAWVVINEVAWAGTAASPNDEWIELWNPGGTDVDLSGWMLTDGGDILVALTGTIYAGGFFLLERTDDTTVGDIPADQIYAGALANSGEPLFLLDPSGAAVDSANGDGGAWPAGLSAARATMERADPARTADSAWCSNDGIHRNGSDANGDPLNGTPRAPFSGFCAALTPTPTRTPTGTPTLTLTPTVLQTPYPPRAVVINEVAWAGTAADSGDEWIELWNPGGADIDLSGWTLTDGGDINVALAGSIPPGGFFILERGGDDTLSDIPAGQLYTGALSNSGEELRLVDPTGGIIDSAGASGQAWPAGSASPAYASMERVEIDPPGWATNNGWTTNGRDAAGNPVRGTPGRANSALFPTPTPTPIPKGVLINEFLPKPGSDWNRDGWIDYNDEFIELLNTGPAAVEIGGWKLDDKLHGGSRPYAIPAGTWIGPRQYLVFFRTQTRIALNDTGDEIWLLAPDGTRVDGRVYTRTRWPDSAWGRYPDGVKVLRLGFPPTPGEPNRLPEDILNPPKEPLTAIPSGWRRVACGPDGGPLLVGEGFLTVGGEDSARAAESYGWFVWFNGACYAWSAPSAERRLPYSNLVPGADSAQDGFGWWWEWWYLR
jgi:hypothetical protein